MHIYLSKRRYETQHMSGFICAIPDIHRERSEEFLFRSSNHYLLFVFLKKNFIYFLFIHFWLLSNLGWIYSNMRT